MTAQFGEHLRYQGEDMTMATEPLEDYFALGGERPSSGSLCTALWRGYLGSWEIVGDRLYLVSLNSSPFGDQPIPLERLFPGYGDRVFAHWYSGTLRVPQGRQLAYVHMGYASTYERDRMLQIERGVLRGTWVRHNAKGAGDIAFQGRGSTS
jgi:hypothetical protein